MQIHEIKRLHPNKDKKMVGRGGKRGKTSGKGTKGQNARAGRKFRPALRDAIKKLPKLRGYNFKSFEVKPWTVNLSEINAVATAGQIISPVTLVELGIIDVEAGRIPKVKVLGSGDITVKVTVSNCDVSETAKAKIEAAGGKVEA